jgi:hypothetical protein
MGAQQAYHFAALFPSACRASWPCAAPPETSPHNQVFWPE